MYPKEWFTDFMGVAYRYFDLRMNVVLLFPDRKGSLRLWRDVPHWWFDSSIRIRFVEDGPRYWFVMDADSRRPDSNMSFFMVLPHSPNYDRFKAGVGDAAYLRFGEYSTRTLSDVKDSDKCDCGHAAGDHDYEPNSVCLYDDCDCTKFILTQVYLLRQKKTVADLKFLDKADIQDDPLAWNCISTHEKLV